MSEAADIRDLLTLPYATVERQYHRGQINQAQWEAYRAVWRYSAPRFSDLVPLPAVRDVNATLDQQEDPYFTLAAALTRANAALVVDLATAPSRCPGRNDLDQQCDQEQGHEGRCDFPETIDDETGQVLR